MPEISYQLRAKIDLPACIGLPTGVGEIKLRLPFGITLQSIRDSTVAIRSSGQVVASFMGQIQPALQPIIAILTVVDLVKKIIDILKALAQIPPDVTAAVELIEEMAVAVGKLLLLVPPLNYVAPMIDITLALTILLDAIIEAIGASIEATQRRLDFEVAMDLNPLLAGYQDCVVSADVAQQESIAFVARTSGSLFSILATFLGILDLPGLHKVVGPLKDVVEQLGSLEGDDITVELIPQLEQVQKLMAQIRVTLQPFA